MEKALHKDLWHPATCVQESCFSLNLLTCLPRVSDLVPVTIISDYYVRGCTLKCSVAFEMGCASPYLQPPGWYFPSFCPTDMCALQELSPGFTGSLKNLLFEQVRGTECFRSEGVNFFGLQVFIESFRLWMCHHLMTVPYRLASCWSKIV